MKIGSIDYFISESHTDFYITMVIEDKMSLHFTVSIYVVNVGQCQFGFGLSRKQLNYSIFLMCPCPTCTTSKSNFSLRNKKDNRKKRWFYNALSGSLCFSYKQTLLAQLRNSKCWQINLFMAKLFWQSNLYFWMTEFKTWWLQPGSRVRVLLSSIKY